jgi:hypothetical protein
MYKKIVVGKTERKRIIEKSRHKLDNNIEIDLMECEINFAGSV